MAKPNSKYIERVSRETGVMLQGASRRPDVVVYGATPAGIIAAIVAVRRGCSVLLADAEANIGGMMSGGLSWTDIKKTVSRAVLPGVVDEFFIRVARHYNLSAQDMLQTQFNAEPRVFLAIFQKMLAEAHIEPQLNIPVVSVRKDGAKIVEVEFDKFGTVRPGVVIDCSYEQDLMAMSGVTYTYGRESSAQFSESNAGVRTPSTTFIPAGVDPYIVPGNTASGVIHGVNADPVDAAGAADKKIQAFTYRLCLKNGASNQTPFPSPDKYDAARYELAARLFAVTAPTQVTDIFTLQQLQGVNKYDCNSSGGFSTNYVSPECTEYVEANWSRRRVIRENIKQHILGFFHFLKNDVRVPGALKTDFANWGLAADEFTGNGNWPTQLYVREGRRMIGDYVLTQADLSVTSGVADEIAFGYYAADSHTVQRVIVSGNVRAEGNILTATTAGYRIPYRVLCPKKAECTNLLSVFGASVSRVAFLSIRMEPKLMAMAQAAAVGASIAVRDRVPVQDVSQTDLLNTLDLYGARRGVVLNTSGEYANGSVVQGGGSWAATSSIFGYVGASALHDQNTGKGKTLTFSPNIPETGLYRVSFKYPPNTAATRANNVPITINHAGGSASITVDQVTTGGGGHWEELGAFTFRKGSPSQDNVVVGTTGTTQTVVASAVRFEKL